MTDPAAMYFRIPLLDGGHLIKEINSESRKPIRFSNIFLLLIRKEVSEVQDIVSYLVRSRTRFLGAPFNI